MCTDDLTLDENKQVLRVSVANVTSEQGGQQQCRIISGPVGIYAKQKVMDGVFTYQQQETPLVTGMRVKLDGCEEVPVEFSREGGTPGEWSQESGGWTLRWEKPTSAPFPVMGTMVVDFCRVGEPAPESTAPIPVSFGRLSTISADCAIQCK